MGELTYYLPEIMFGVFALVAIIWGILFVRDMVRRSGGKAFVHGNHPPLISYRQIRSA